VKRCGVTSIYLIFTPQRFAILMYREADHVENALRVVVILNDPSPLASARAWPLRNKSNLCVKQISLNGTFET
jgi:hypothetical protein